MRPIRFENNEAAVPDLVGVMVLLDRSASMSGIRTAMERAFAGFLDDQRAARPDGMWLSLHHFDTEGYDVVYDRTPLADVGALQLQPRGGTPLRDALYRFGTEAKRIVDDPEDQTERLLLVVITDGEENSSTLHTWQQVRTLLQSIDGPACELIWLGTSAAILEAQDQEKFGSVFTQAGASAPFTASAQGAYYAGSVLRSATMGMRAGASAKRVTLSYLSSTKQDEVPEQDDALTAESLKKLQDAVGSKRFGDTGKTFVPGIPNNIDDKAGL